MGKYTSPETEVIRFTQECGILQASNWNNGSMDDGFNNLYEL